MEQIVTQLGSAGTGECAVARDFDDFYRCEFSGLVALAAAVLGQGQSAEDVVQESMLDAHRRWDRLSTYDAPRAWLRRAVVQRAVKATRKGANERLAALRARPLEADGREPSAGLLDTTLRDALVALPAQQRASLALHYLEDASVLETAQILGVSEGTIKTHLHRGRQRLAEHLRSQSRSGR